jgi:hypothetical protein
MYIITRYDVKKDTDTVWDVVETKENLQAYMEELITVNPKLKWYQQIPNTTPHIGHTVIILHNTEEEYMFQRYEYVTKPSLVKPDQK